MEINETTLREHYATLASEQLLELYGRGTLTQQATEVVNAVLDERGVPAALRGSIAAAIRAGIAARDRELQLSERLRAPWGLRIFARLVDSAIVAAGFAAGGPALVRGSVLCFLAIGPAVLYFLLADALPNGQSLGKRLAGIAVVDSDSLHPCTSNQSMQRNWLVTSGMGWFLILMMLAGRGRPSYRGYTRVVRKKVLRDVRRR